MLLADPELDGGGIIQLAPGDTLPDGRILAAVTDNSITLASLPEGDAGSADPAASGGTGTGAEGMQQEVLLLFPRGAPDPATGPGR